MDPTVRLDRCSEPSVSVNAALIDSAIALSSLPVAGATVTVGTSATGLTVTLRLAVVDAVGPLAPACEVAVTVRAKSTSEFAGGVTLRLPRFQPRTLIELWVDRKSTGLNSSHQIMSYAVVCTKKHNRCSEP